MSSWIVDHPLAWRHERLLLGSPRIIEETRQYIRDFDRIAETATAARELYDQMLKLHPLRMNVNAAMDVGARDQGITP
jgi:hypothetical protein